MKPILCDPKYFESWKRNKDVHKQVLKNRIVAEQAGKKTVKRYIITMNGTNTLSGPFKNLEDAKKHLDKIRKRMLQLKQNNSSGDLDKLMNDGDKLKIETIELEEK